MEVGNLYVIVLSLVMVGMILGVGILVLDKFGATTSITKNTQTVLNNTRDSITSIGSTWLPLIVTVVVLAIILTLVIRSFAFGPRE